MLSNQLFAHLLANRNSELFTVVSVFSKFEGIKPIKPLTTEPKFYTSREDLQSPYDLLLMGCDMNNFQSYT